MNMLLKGDCLEVLRSLLDNSVDSMVTDPPAGIGFMNADWDSDKGGRDEWIAWLSSVMREALRVLKPGAHALVWAIPKTSHWTSMAIENAGFEVRDVINHHYGQGFPKSRDISKDIDKLAGAERPVIAMVPQGGAKFQLAADAIDNGGFNDPGRKEYAITAPATEGAKKWEGWGTALKPATEHWILARKPFKGTTVRNVLEHGTGALNIGECRVGDEVLPAEVAGQAVISTFGRDGMVTPERVGRWPANLAFTCPCPGDEHLDGCPVGVLEKQSAGTSRFFYVAKPTREEKERGLEGSEETTTNDGREKAIDNAYQRGETPRKNPHPTVKPIALMRYFCKLITPPGGVVLDAFMGSGTTGVAAIQEGFGFVGIEMQAEYCEIARRRIAAATAIPREILEAG